MPVFRDPLFPRPGDSPTRRRSPSTSPQARNAVVSVPLRTAVQSSGIKATSGDKSDSPPRAYEPYNPYPPRARTGRGRAFRSSWPEISLVALLAFAGFAFMSTFFIQKFAERQVLAALTKAVAPLKETASFTFGRVNVSLFKGLVQVRNIDVTLTASGETVHMDRVAIWGLDRTSLKTMLFTRKPVLPETVKISIDGAAFPIELFGLRAQTILSALGYDALNMSSFVSLHFDRAGRAFTLENLRVTAPKVGQIDLSFALEHITLPSSAELTMIKRDPRKFLEADFSKMTIKDFAFSFSDDSVTNRVLDAMRLIPGETSPITLVEMAMEMNGGATGPATPNVDFVKPALRKLHDFLMYPRTLSLRAHPSEPVALLTLLDEQSGGFVNELAHRLNLRVD